MSKQIKETDNNKEEIVKSLLNTSNTTDIEEILKKRNLIK